MATSSKTVEEKYQKLTQLEHVLRLPDSYVGSVHPVVEDRPVIVNDRIVYQSIEYVPGLYKIFDELVVNARDHRVRDPTVKHIKIDLDKDSGSISVYNDGSGIECVMHSEHNMYVAQLIFGNLLTSTNYDQDEKKVVGGRNGYGAKLTSIFSTSFKVETVDALRKKKYVQEWCNNMNDVDPPKISACSLKPYTRVTFVPDYRRFSVSNMTEGIYKVFEKRVYDLAASTPADLTVTLNGTVIKMKGFDKYVDWWLGPRSESPRVYEKLNDRWEVAVAVSPDGRYNQVSFVNGIVTNLGGRHVDHVTNQVTKKLVEHISKKKKKTVKPAWIRDNIWVFVNCVVESPSFSSQTKETLTTPVKDFGSKCEITDAFVEKLGKAGVIDKALELLNAQDDKALSKTDGKKRNMLRGYPKLEDAVCAGGPESSKCSLLICEGDSAKAFAVAGLAVAGRDYYGVVPVRGKPLNVRDATPKQLQENNELAMIKAVLGLQNGKVYNDASELRYSSVTVISDADVDGSHIKGLLINLFHHFWPSLLKNVPNFITSMLTPIIKATHGKEVKTFYTLSEYNEWKAAVANSKKFTIKYYKGLGTSTSAEAREYFKSIDTSRVTYVTCDDIEDVITLAFEKKRADDRKRWLLQYQPDSIIEQTEKRITVHDFVHKDLIHFSNHDNVRSIPSVMDGLKPSQRKVLYGCLKKNLKTEMKVAQLSGAVAEISAYHSGEASLQGTIVAMAHDFVGSNNINLLQPNGQFGTRLQGGKDAASARYIFTQLSSITNDIFKAEDSPLLDYLDDDGYNIEPVYYVPVVPLVLVNGATGIGTGFSTNVACHNPRDVAANIIRLLNGQPTQPMTPWYRGYCGEITPTERGWMSYGIWKRLDDKTIEVTELPIGRWTDDYKEFLESASFEDPTNGNKKRRQLAPISSYSNYSTEANVRFVVKLSRAVSDRDIPSVLHLTTAISISNMHLYNSRGVIQRYDSTSDIFAEFFGVRMKHYEKRREYLKQKQHKRLTLSLSKLRFLQEIQNDTISVYKKSKVDIEQLLDAAKYPRLGTETDMVPGEQTGALVSGDFSYLTSMQIASFTEERLAELEKVIQDTRRQLADLEQITPAQMWREDIDTFLSSLSLQDEKDILAREATSSAIQNIKVGKKKRQRITSV